MTLCNVNPMGNSSSQLHTANIDGMHVAGIGKPHLTAASSQAVDAAPSVAEAA